jgi:hypothetical protein
MEDWRSVGRREKFLQKPMVRFPITAVSLLCFQKTALTYYILMFSQTWVAGTPYVACVSVTFLSTGWLLMIFLLPYIILESILCVCFKFLSWFLFPCWILTYRLILEKVTMESRDEHKLMNRYSEEKVGYKV